MRCVVECWASDAIDVVGRAGPSEWPRQSAMRNDWPAGFETASVSAALDALEDIGVSTKLTVPVCGDIRFDDVEIGSDYIDCTTEARFRRTYPRRADAFSDASRIKRILVRWLDWPIQPGVISAENGGTLTNASRARIRLCLDADQYWKIRQSPLVDLSVPAIYVITESGLFKAVRVVGRELTMAPIRRRARGLGEVGGALVMGMLGLLFVLGCCVSAVGAVFGFGLLLGLW